MVHIFRFLYCAEPVQIKRIANGDRLFSFRGSVAEKKSKMDRLLEF